MATPASVCGRRANLREKQETRTTAQYFGDGPTLKIALASPEGRHGKGTRP